MTGPLSINAYSPVIRASDESFHELLQTEKEGYTITDGIGFDAASFTLTGPLDYLVHWFEHGLVRDVVWRSPVGGVAWNGYVSRLIFTVSGNTRTEAVTGMANRILYTYTPLDTSTNPPQAGAQTIITKNDTGSQDRYGIKTGVVSGGECTAATADDMALAALARLKDTRLGETIAVGAGKTPALKVEMRGYGHMANWYYYTQTASSGTSDADAIVGLVLAADPNGVLSASTINIDTCATAIEQYWDGKQLGWKIVQDITGRGYETGGVGYRWSVGVYEGRKTTYKQSEAVDSNGVPLSTNKHLILHRHVHDAGDSILDDAGKEIMPWEMRPDRLIYTEGIPGRPMRITQVKFTAPFGLSLSGTDELSPSKAYLRRGC